MIVIGEVALWRATSFFMPYTLLYIVIPPRGRDGFCGEGSIGWLTMIVWYYNLGNILRQYQWCAISFYGNSSCTMLVWSQRISKWSRDPIHTNISASKAKGPTSHCYPIAWGCRVCSCVSTNQSYTGNTIVYINSTTCINSTVFYSLSSNSTSIKCSNSRNTSSTNSATITITSLRVEGTSLNS